MFKIRRKYLLFTIGLLIIEIAIALFIHDKIIRPYVGDILVAMLVYSFIRTLFPLSTYVAAVITLLFCYMVEAFQYINIVQVLGIEKSKLASIAIGQSFDWIDLLMYTTGILIVLIFEKTSFILNKNLVRS